MATKKKATRVYDDRAVRGFIQLSRAWYGPSCIQGRQDKGLVDDVYFGLMIEGPDRPLKIPAAENPTAGMYLEWVTVPGFPSVGPSTPFARFVMYEDALRLLRDFNDLFLELSESNGTNLQPAEFCAMLQRYGFRDLTPEKE
jgi:hypothetical protein